MNNENPILPSGAIRAVPQIETLAEVEKKHILHALDVMKGNKSHAAKALGVSLKTLYNKMNEYSKQSEGK